MQRSLSSEDRTLEDSLTEGQLVANKSAIINITNKSVNFNSRTEIQVPATPSPKSRPGGGSKFRTEEGATKVNDGKSKGVQVKQFANSQVDEMMMEKKNISSENFQSVTEMPQNVACCIDFHESILFSLWRSCSPPMKR